MVSARYRQPTVISSLTSCPSICRGLTRRGSHSIPRECSNETSCANPQRRWKCRSTNLKQEASTMSFEVIIPFLKPIEHLLTSRTVSEIMVNPDGSVWIEEMGHIVPTSAVQFEEGALL